jgi:hypothetical protein
MTRAWGERQHADPQTRQASTYDAPMPGEPVIRSASFVDEGSGLDSLGGRRTLRVVFSDGREEDLLSWFSDELPRLEESHFLGLSQREARTLFHATDVAYLRS